MSAHLILAALVLPLVSLSAVAQPYKYTDDEGAVHYVDDLEKIPPPYRQQHQSLEIDSRPLSQSQQQRIDEHLQNLREELLDAAEQRQAREQRRRARRSGLRVRIVGNQVLVPVSLGYRGNEIRTTLVLDTGASITALHEGLRARLDVPSLGRSQSRLADGSVIDARIGRLDYIKLGSQQIDKVWVAFIASKGGGGRAAGLLGMNVLKQFNYTIDFANSVLRLRLR